MMRRRSLLLAVPSLLAARSGAAQAWPTRSISWIVPFPPGGITDTSARLVAQGLGTQLGQPVVVENRPGAGGSIGTEAAARAAPDGYTILYGTQGTLATNPVLYKGTRYDPLRDFVPLHGLTQTPLLLLCHPGRPFRDLGALIALAKQRPGELTFATSGVGTGTHMAAELFQGEAGVRLTHVPYQGSAPALNDLVAGRVDIMFDYLVATRGHIEGDRLRPLATTGPARLPVLPEVPSIAEAGLPGAVTDSWSAIIAPAAIPAPVAARLTAGLAAAMAEPRVVQALAAGGSTPLMLSGAPLQEFVGREIIRWRGVVERSGAAAG
ncbi:Bug family tripartite tricarboxylate transporter substrate binding protein [Dankookia sp. GCM10030260]|uniref:Bug family tripartite tricarboxylate transporter substrate binding protein n=1 Tax=Dankookia sp. GCM10030260 TaxID=3273390 RepID=UPI00361ED4DF